MLLWLLCWLWSPGVANWYRMAWPWGWVTTGAKFDLVGHFYTPTFSSLEFISFRCQIHQRRRAQYFGTGRNDHSLHEWIACGKHKILQKTLKGPWRKSDRREKQRDPMRYMSYCENWDGNKMEECLTILVASRGGFVSLIMQLHPLQQGHSCRGHNSSILFSIQWYFQLCKHSLRSNIGNCSWFYLCR